MVLKLYAASASTCGQRVAIVLNEKGIPFEFNLVDFASGEHKSPEYLKKQPFGQVPYLVRRSCLGRKLLLTIARTMMASFCTKAALSADISRPNTLPRASSSLLPLTI